jgi:hypothetical protein
VGREFSAVSVVVAALLGVSSATRAMPATTRAEVGIPTAQSRALARILGGFPSLRLSGRVGRPPREDGQPRAAWVYYKMRVQSAPDQVRAYWQGKVASGVLRDVSRRRQWPRVLGHRFTLALPNGRHRFDSESVLGRAFQGTIEAASEAELRTLLEESSVSAGVRMMAVRFARPLGRLAPQITVETSDPRAFARHAAENVWTIVSPINRGTVRPRAEGTFVYVHDPNRVWVAVFGYAVRTSAGASVINPRFE